MSADGAEQPVAVDDDFMKAPPIARPLAPQSARRGAPDTSAGTSPSCRAPHPSPSRRHRRSFIDGRLEHPEDRSRLARLCADLVLENPVHVDELVLPLGQTEDARLFAARLRAGEEDARFASRNRLRQVRADGGEKGFEPEVRQKIWDRRHDYQVGEPDRRRGKGRYARRAIDKDIPELAVERRQTGAAAYS